MSTKVTGLKLESRRGQSADLLAQKKLFCLGSRDPWSHLGAARLEVVGAGTWKTPSTCRSVTFLALREGALQPGALSTLASTRAPRASSNGIGTKQLSALAVSRYHPRGDCHQPPDAEAELSSAT